jgi:hypothetical protein
MERKAGGTLALAAALTVLVVVPRLLNPPVVAGTAAAVPPPPAPAVGTCLANSVTSSWGARGVLRPSDTVYVDCHQPHRAEIFRVVDPLPAGEAGGTVFDRCTRDSGGVDYLGTTTDGWRPELQMRITASGPDARQVAAGQRWAACVFVDDVGPALAVPLAGSAAGHGVPPQVGVCFDGSATDLAFRGTTPCDLPHGGELFGSRPVDATSDAGALTASCRALVAADTRNPTLVDTPGLRTEAVLSADVLVDGVLFDTREEPAPDGSTGTARCVVRAVEGRQLTGSLRLLGDAAPPWTG